jgi:hypothetical protein
MTVSPHSRLTISLPLWVLAAGAGGLVLLLCLVLAGLYMAARHHQQIQEAAQGVWTDRATGLMWTIKDNGTVVNWNEAVNYCRSLNTGGYTGSRLPDRVEMDTLFERTVLDRSGHRLKGGIKLSGENPFLWTATVDGPGYGPGTSYAMVLFPPLVTSRAGAICR